MIAHPESAPSERWEFTDRIALALDPKTSLDPFLTAGRITWLRTPVPGVHVLQASDAETAWRMASAWNELPEVRAVHPVVHPPWSSQDAYAGAPDDEFFRAWIANVEGQWYLENRDPDTGARLGVDLNLRPAWALSRGAGVTVGVADTGVQLEHPDLARNLQGAPHFNFDTRQPTGQAVLTGGRGAHGTSAAGLVAGIGDNALGMSGVAPGARVASWVIYTPRGQTVTDEQLGDVFRHAANTVPIQNHSWGPTGTTQRGPTLLEETGIEEAWRLGRSGLGTVMVRAAGNERARGAQAGDDGFANDPRVITVGAVRRNGHFSSFSEPGACLLVAAPAGDADEGGLFTTDFQGIAGANFISFFPPFEHLSDYRWGALGFTGTSAAAPLVSGVAALMLSVNPSLGARDVQQALLLSAWHPDPRHPDIQTNGAGLRVSHDLGFGLVDAAEAVRWALRWSNRPAASEVRRTNSASGEIPDGGFEVVLEPGADDGAAFVASGLPGTGLHPETATVALPLVDLGLALGDPTGRLEGRGVLIERGGVPFQEKLVRAATFGAAFAVVFNAATNEVPAGSCPGGEQLCVLAGTDDSPIPALFLRRSDGLALRDLIAAAPERPAALRLNGIRRSFTISDSLQCEAVGVRIRTDHSGRGDLRITLRSPSGTVSVLQRYNADIGPGPTDWTYWSTHHFFEPSAGTWELQVTDQAPDEGRGSLLEATLIVRGVPVVDDDRDGL
ncbi:MAG: S8 family serine peptidase, partial [Verrucomicrobia bacterium]|nr:S8 family serine peptidase [Verrucomicrobiota bacterium]